MSTANMYTLKKYYNKQAMLSLDRFVTMNFVGGKVKVPEPGRLVGGESK
jgi:hypothetical protein